MAPSRNQSVFEKGVRREQSNKETRENKKRKREIEIEIVREKKREKEKSF